MIDMYECSHEELAIEPIHDATMAGNCVSKVLKNTIIINVVNCGKNLWFQISEWCSHTIEINLSNLKLLQSIFFNVWLKWPVNELLCQVSGHNCSVNSTSYILLIWQSFWSLHSLKSSTIYSHFSVNMGRSNNDPNTKPTMKDLSARCSFIEHAE